MQSVPTFRSQSSVNQPKDNNGGTGRVMGIDRTCYNCREPDHYAASCPYKQNQNKAPTQGNPSGNVRTAASGAGRNGNKSRRSKSGRCNLLDGAKSISSTPRRRRKHRMSLSVTSPSTPPLQQFCLTPEHPILSLHRSLSPSTRFPLFY